MDLSACPRRYHHCLEHAELKATSESGYLTTYSITCKESR